MAKIRQTIDTSEADRAFVQEFETQVDMLASMVREMFVEEKVMLLSPVLRELMADKGALVASMLGPLKNRLCADNPGEDLKPWRD